MYKTYFHHPHLFLFLPYYLNPFSILIKYIFDQRLFQIFSYQSNIHLFYSKYLSLTFCIFKISFSHSFLNKSYSILNILDASFLSKSWDYNQFLQSNIHENWVNYLHIIYPFLYSLNRPTKISMNLIKCFP